jgi:hypothetical protein
MMPATDIPKNALAIKKPSIESRYKPVVPVIAYSISEVTNNVFLLPLSMMIPANGAEHAIIKLGIVSINFTRNTALGKYAKASAIFGRAGEIADTDITVRLLAKRSMILLIFPSDVMFVLLKFGRQYYTNT